MREKKGFLSSSIFSDLRALDNVLISFLDIGARGDLPPPWRQLEERFPERLQVAGFETDKEELLELKKKYPSRTYFPVGLGKTDGVSPFFLNNSKSTSSLFSPNKQMYEVFDEKHSRGRVIERKLEVEISRLDSLDLSSYFSAFVKLDVQGAELDILIGGKEFFKKNATGFSVETWSYEVYENQPLMHEVMKWASDNGYELYGLEESGRWDFRSMKPLGQRGAPVCVDLLYFRSFESFFGQSPSLQETISFALVLDLWGFPSRALSLLECYPNQSEVDQFAQLIRNCRKRPWFEKHKLNDIVDKLYAKLGLTPYFPPIHD